VALLPALRRTFQNTHFRYYVVADFAYFMGLTIINTGLLYFVTVLLLQEEGLVSSLVAIMVIVSFLFYPAVNVLAKRTGKKVLIVASFTYLSVLFVGIFFLGRLPLPNQVQAYLVVILYALPLAFLGVLPNAILGDIATHDALKTGEAKEGMFFAARTLLQKFGQSFGVLIFAALTTFGKDPGDDLGIRLSGVVGFLLCVVAALVFTRYDERQLMQEMDALEASRPS
jgi:GPH family glycoside/pentoside/hexuronide:cation symporter